MIWIVKSQWINGADSEPWREYFDESKLDIWLNYCDMAQDAHEKVAEVLLNGYTNETNELVVKKLAGIK